MSYLEIIAIMAGVFVGFKIFESLGEVIVDIIVRVWDAITEYFQKFRSK